MIRTVSWLLCCGALALVFSPALHAQAGETTDDDEQRRVLHDQSRMAVRLTSLREKMVRLSERYETEGRTHNAQLLRDALAKFDADGLLDQARDIEQSLSRGRLDTVGKQDVLGGSLESIYAVLRDRRDEDELRSRVDLTNEAIAELGNLITDQGRLLSRTRAATDTPDELVKSALETAQSLEQALEATAEANDQARVAESGLAELDLAEKLAAAQRQLEGSPEPTAARQRALIDGMDALLVSLSEPLGEAGSPEAMERVEELRSEARAAASRARRAAERAEQALRKTESGRESGSDPSSEPSGDPSSEQNGEPSGDPSSEQNGEAASPPGSESASPADASPGAPSGSESQPSADSEPQEPASGPESDAAQESAQDGMAEAAEHLEQARDVLRDVQRQLGAARNRAMAGARLNSREAQEQGAQLDDLAERLESLEPEAGPELLDRTRELLEQLAALTQSLEQGRSSQAAQLAGQSRSDVQSLLDQLRNRGASAGSEPASEPSAEQVAQMVADQRALERQLHELMDRLGELPDQTFQTPAEQASAAMEQASRSMESGDRQESGTRQEEAKQKLEQAKQELEGERDRYERLRQEELLFRLAEELTNLLDEQRRIRSEVEEVRDGRGDSLRLSRSLRRALARLASEERDLSRQTEEMRVALEQDDAVAFVFALEQTRNDIDDVAGRLADRQTDGFVLALIEGVEQRIADLLAVLDAERERRREAMQNPEEGGEQQPQDGTPPLVPQVAELLLVQRLELAALSRLERFKQRHPEMQDGELGPMERRLIEHWALEHTRITEVFEQMLPPPAPEPVMDLDQLSLDPHDGSPDPGGENPDGAEPETPDTGLDTETDSGDEEQP